MSSKLELISFKLCPFVQRTIIVLKQKQMDFDITYIDINDPPEWFKSLSPLGQVPVLKVGDEVLFESSVIQEYVDEITPPSLHPSNPLTKAKNRAWIQFGGDILMANHAMNMAKDETLATEKRQLITSKLAQLEQQHSGEKFFNGNDFNLVDAAFAPMLMRLDFLNTLTGDDLLANTPKLKQWQTDLLAMPAVQDSVVPGIIKMYRGMLQHFDGFVARNFLD